LQVLLSQCDQLIRFEAQNEAAWRGRAPEDAGGTLNATEFLLVVQDLLTFAVESWDTDTFGRSAGQSHGIPSSNIVRSSANEKIRILPRKHTTDAIVDERFKSPRGRSQRRRLNWECLDRLAQQWLPRARIVHP